MSVTENAITCQLQVKGSSCLETWSSPLPLCVSVWYACLHVCRWMWAQCTCVFRSPSLSALLTQSLWTQSSPILTSLARWLVPGVPCALPLQGWDYKHATPVWHVCRFWRSRPWSWCLHSECFILWVSPAQGWSFILLGSLHFGCCFVRLGFHFRPSPTLEPLTYTSSPFRAVHFSLLSTPLPIPSLLETNPKALWMLGKHS